MTVAETRGKGLINIKEILGLENQGKKRQIFITIAESSFCC
jgi:hypothetical protein